MTYWKPDKLEKASKLLSDAAHHLYIYYPDSASRPDQTALPAVKAMIEAALEYIKQAQP